MNKSPAIRTRLALSVALVLALSSVFAAVAVPASAGKRKPGGGSGSTGGGTISLVQTNPTHGDSVTFATTTSYAYPTVAVTCTKGGVLVYSDSHPAYWPNFWDDPGVFILASIAWSSGAADCRADLKGTSSNGRSVVLASTSFYVAA